MCNEREDSVWFIHGGKTDEQNKVSVNSDNTISLSYNPDAWSTCAITNSIYTKDEHASAGVGLNRKFDTALVADVDKVFQSKWEMPEYLPFRECIKMAIQDGIVAGMERAAGKYEPMLDEKDTQIKGLEEKVEFWKGSFSKLYEKCRQGIAAFEFIRKVINMSTDHK